MELAMRDDVRAKLEIPKLDEVTQPPLATAADRPLHFHVWIERGWSGGWSPAYRSIQDANEAIRALADEDWCDGIRSSWSFPFSQVFLMLRGEVDGDGRQRSLNAVLKECTGANQRGSQRACNRTRRWQ